MQLLLLLPFYFFSFALGSLSDILYIEKLNADEAQALDNKDFAALEDIFTKNATYNHNFPSSPTVYGIDKIKTVLASDAPPGVISQNTASTESIQLLPPFDEQGAASTATGVVYTTTSFIGQGDLEGQGLFFFAKYKDKYVKTGNFALYGGWRISERIYIAIKLNADVAQASDNKAFSEFENFFTQNITYNIGVVGEPNVYGLDNLKARLTELLPPGSITQQAVNTQSITLLSPFDEQGDAGTATSVVYSVITFIGQGDLAGQARIGFGKFNTKYVKAGDFARYGGWRISERFFIFFVSFPKVD
ncbi:hypothetical protein MMC29_007580 [Sticta canariensis]|nr:hypothetical protein [Sticta canariensis]